MMKKYVSVLLIACFLATSAAGCTWMGRTTGKAVKNVEKGADKFEKGYEEGRKK